MSQVRRDVEAMFDDAAREIGDVKSAVRTVVEVDRAEAFFGGGEEFGVWKRVCAGDDGVFFSEARATQEISCGFANEGPTVEAWVELIAPINERGAGGGEGRERTIGAKLRFLVAAI